jgi:tetratricopeptide (TPR) repeat protein
MDFWLDEITKATGQELSPILEHWSRIKPWATLPAVEREELAETISKQAADILTHPNQEKKARQLFELALGIAPVSARVFLLQGVALYKKAQASAQAQELLIAKEKFEKALALHSGFDEARFWLAHCALLTYEKQGDEQALEEARLHLQRTSQSATHLPWARLRAKWHWLWAQASQEPSDYRLAISVLKKTIELDADPLLECYMALAMIRLTQALSQDFVVHELVKLLRNLLSHDLNASQWQELASSCHAICSAFGYRELLHVGKELWQKAYETSQQKLAKEDFEKYVAISLLIMELEPSALNLREIETLLRKRAQSHDENPMMFFLWKCHARLCWFEFAEKPAQLKQLLSQMEAYRLQAVQEPHYWLLKGSCQAALGDYFREVSYIQEAMESLQKGLGIDSDRPGLWARLGRACLSLGDINFDVEATRRATQIFPFAIICGRYDWEFWMDWGLALFRMADATGERAFLSEAIARFEKALEIARRDEKQPSAHLLYLYGAALDFLGDLSREESHYERAVEMLELAAFTDPSHPQAMLSLAVALTHAGEATSKREFLEKASAVFETLASQDHEDDYLWNEWAVCLLSLCRLDLEEGIAFDQQLHRAIIMLNKAFCLGNQHALYNLCCAYTLCGDKERALDYLEKAMDTGVHPPVEDMAEDEWLDEIRSVERFQRLIENSKKDKGDPSDPEGEEPEDPEEPWKDPPGRGNLTAS